MFWLIGDLFHRSVTCNWHLKNLTKPFQNVYVL